MPAVAENNLLAVLWVLPYSNAGKGRSTTEVFRRVGSAGPGMMFSECREVLSGLESEGLVKRDGTGAWSRTHPGDLEVAAVLGGGCLKSVEG